MKKSNLLILVLSSTLLACGFSFAKEEAAADCKKQIEELKEFEGNCPCFRAVMDEYVRENKYNEFAAYLKTLTEKNKSVAPCANYYIALTRYRQLKYLEEQQLWDEYFNEGNAYREDLVSCAQAAIDATTPADSAQIYSRLALWQFHQDQQDAFAEESLIALTGALGEYAKSAKDYEPLREAADILSGYGEKSRSKELYRLYAQKVISPDSDTPDLERLAAGFFSQGNLGLAETIYDAYIERVIKAGPKEKALPVLTGLARQFSYQPDKPNDPLYAEKVFMKVEELGGKEVFDQELMYLRANNLEKAKDYAKAKDYFVQLTGFYPGSTYADEADFKTGVIFTYILRNAKEGEDYFKKLAKKEEADPWAISSLYHLGLLLQWQDDFEGAKKYYTALVEKAKDGFADTVALAKERLKEINERKPLEYNLDTFLDASLKEESGNFDMSKVETAVAPNPAKPESDVEISSSAYTTESGCMQVVLQYLWSGDLASETPPGDKPALRTKYPTPGTKVVFLVVTSPVGIIDRGIAIVDVR
ncbi:MAG: hypothetical protein FJZ09_04670 [Candidatus Omnitrophica bacterium]|nr:hypothetical protein [Candidatus Omnitrophota bacterium]